jgi:hypothetical protein
MNRFHEQNYYEILEIAPAAQQHEIHRAYQRAKSTYSQDNPALYSMFSREEALQVMRLIDEAYTVLGNPTLRAAYDDRRTTMDKLEVNGQKGSVPYVAPSPAPTSNRVSPDFVIPEADMTAWQEPISGDLNSMAPGMTRPTPIHPSISPAPKTLPDGHGHTRFSVYKIDKEFEEVLVHLQSYDGEMLRKVRRYKELTLQQIASATNIGLHYLEAIERNDYLALPAAVFVRGFVAQYAKLLGLDERRVCQSYMQLFKESRGT